MFIWVPGPARGFRNGNQAMITLQRVYDAAPSAGSYKVLVDRLWPRGISREEAPWDEWLREVAPSDALRREFHADPSRWTQFREHYLKELAGKTELLEHLKRLEKAHGMLILLYAAKSEEQNNASVLRECLLGSGKNG